MKNFPSGAWFVERDGARDIDVAPVEVEAVAHERTVKSGLGQRK
jgi:hypothetical protein